MAQAAARAFPSKYRLLGGGFADDTDPTISGDPGVNRTTTLGPDNYGRNDQ
jgi:predicted ATP-dependent serine protease